MSIIFTRNFQPRKSLRHFKNWPVRFFPVARNKHHVQYDLLGVIHFGSFEVMHSGDLLKSILLIWQRM